MSDYNNLDQCFVGILGGASTQYLNLAKNECKPQGSCLFRAHERDISVPLDLKSAQKDRGKSELRLPWASLFRTGEP